MGDMINILGIAGSLRQGSFNRSTLNASVELVPDGAKIEVYDIDGFPGYNQDLDSNPPAKLPEFKQKIRESAAILIVSPEYNYSVPGVLKNAIDWASRPYGDSAWEGKPAAIMGASTGAVGTARMQYHLRQTMVFLNMFPLNRPEVMIGHAGDKFDANGNLTDEKTREHIRKTLVALVEWTRKLKSS